MSKVVILTLYPKGIAPGPRFRYEQYLGLLEQRFDVELFSFFNERDYKNIQFKKNIGYSFWSTVKGYLASFFHLFKSFRADYVFVFRDITPFGPPVFEWIIAKVFKKKIIYDFDDAIWLPDINSQNKFKVWLRNPKKTDKIISWAYKVSCGNAYLCEHARLNNHRVVINPTTIDTEGLHNQMKDQYTERVVIGWTGTHSTLKYLDPLLPLIAKLEKEFDFTFLVICDKNPCYNLKSYMFVPWNKTTEKNDLLRMNFGVMPLSDDEWSKGKCGFKALQYMALGMPALVSPVGVNAEIVTDGVNGFICCSLDEWEMHIRQLLQYPDLRQRLGKSARERVLNHYSVISNTSNFLSLFDINT